MTETKDQNAADAAEISRLINELDALADRMDERMGVTPATGEDECPRMYARVRALTGAAVVCLLAAEEYMTALRLDDSRLRPARRLRVQ